MKQKKESFFWASYSDLMTSLFFVMLVLFVLTITLLHNRMRQILNNDKTEIELINRINELEDYITEIEAVHKVTAEQLNKIMEVQKATENIDDKYFSYKSEYKKHILKISVRFNSGSADINNISFETRDDLKKAGESIVRFINDNSKEGIQYMLIIEGQASRDIFSRNYELSYERALSLKKFWEANNISFGSSCEVLISGSGDGKLGGTDFMREIDEKMNQRFLIHIVPKYGKI